MTSVSRKWLQQRSVNYRLSPEVTEALTETKPRPEFQEGFLLGLNVPGPLSFSIELVEGGMIDCEEIVRVIPGKRIVCRGQWNNCKVYAKIFLGLEARRYARRDREGMVALAQAGIRAPQLLHTGEERSGKAQILVFAAIENGVNAEAAYAALSAQADQRLQLAKNLVATVAHHHRAGLMQTDLYLKNFLLQGGQVYTLDGDAIRPLPRMFQKRVTLNNLALLISKFDVVDANEWLPQLLGLYAQELHLPEALELDDMRKRIASIRRRVTAKYADHKVFRDCTEVQVTRTFSRYLAITRMFATGALKQALGSPDALVEDLASLRLKSGNTCTVVLTEIAGHKVVLKRYNIKNFWHGLNRAFRPSRAAVSWSNAYRLKMHEVATATPITLVEIRCGFIRRQAYFITEYVDAPDAGAFFANAEVPQRDKMNAAAALARLFWKLYLLGISHGDFKASNVKIVEGQPLLIDLDSMRQHRCRKIFERRHVRDLRRFMLNWRQDSATKALLANAFRDFYRDSRPLQRAGWL